MTTDTNGCKTTLLKHMEIEDTLLEHSWIHLAQAEGSNFTQEPLSRLLQYGGLTVFGDHITQGKLVPDRYQFDEPTLAILQNL